MPNESEHAEKYRQNRVMLDGPPTLVSVSGPWAATVAFYAAVHLIEQLAAHEGIHHARHVGQASRAGYLATHPVHRVLVSDLSALYSVSRIARYDSATMFATAYPGDMVQTILIDQCLARIEAHVRVHLP